jgi:hypothetical protein
MAAVHLEAQVQCPADSCAAVYDLVETADGATATRHHDMFTCPTCSAGTPVATGALPIRFRCDGCGGGFMVTEGVFVTYERPEASQDE